MAETRMTTRKMSQKMKVEVKTEMLAASQSQQVMNTVPQAVPQQVMNTVPQAVPQQAPSQAAGSVQVQEPLTASMLAEVPPSEHKHFLGERLFPLIEGLYPDLAGKITDMLLEIDNSELVHMLEHQESLENKVEEAVAALQAKNCFENIPEEFESALKSSMFAAAPPNEQKQMLREHLFPLIEGLYPDLADKITGMLLEIDNSELVHIVEHQESLKNKVEEAAAFLQVAKTASTTTSGSIIQPGKNFGYLAKQNFLQI